MAGNPPFSITQGKPGPWERVAGPEVSDGDVRHWPGLPLCRPIPETHYLIVLATAWVKSQKLDQPFTNYYLDKLPDGYALFEVARVGSEGPSYKRLFGHPTGRYYDSAVRFEAHFKWLMNRMEGNCECLLCSGRRPPATRGPDAFRQHAKTLSRPESRTQSREITSLQQEDSRIRSKSATGLAFDREKRQPKAGEPAMPVDEEGTEDIYKKQIQDLYKFKHKRVKDKLVERYSFDWKAERKSLPPHFSQISLQHSFIPRVGELVLWCPYFPDELDLVFNSETGFYQFYSFEQECFLGFPNWHGGVVAAAPSSIAVDGPLDFPDILSNPGKKTAYNTSGFRVETFPDPNNDTDKSLSKRYRYVPLRQIRPLSHWQILLRGIPERKLDPSIKYALTAMTTVSLHEKFQFVGDWPNASIHCKGIYLGAELIVVGDAVRILPPTPTRSDTSTSAPTPLPKHKRCTDVLVISSIRLNLLDITAEHTLPTSRHLSTHSSITLVGHAYTLEPHRHYRITLRNNATNLTDHSLAPPPSLPLEAVKSTFPTVGAQHYGDWYPLQAPHQKYEVSFDRVLGRLHEADAVRLWLGMSQTKSGLQRKPHLSYDLDGVLAGRRYGTQTDERIPALVPSPSDGQIAWFWADTRVQALNVETFNGYEVGAYDVVRDRATTRAWRAMLRVLDGTATVQDVKDTGLPQRKGRQKGARLVDGKVVYPGDSDSGDDGEEVGADGRRVKRQKKEKKKEDRRFSFGGAAGGGGGGGGGGGQGMGNSQMLLAGLAQDSDDDEDEDDDDDQSTGNEFGTAELIVKGDIIGSGNVVETALAMAREQRQSDPDPDSFPVPRRPQLARKNVLGRHRQPKGHGTTTTHRIPSKMQIMASVEADSDSDPTCDSDNAEEEEIEEEEEDYDYEAVKDLVEGALPLARGGTEESEGGDYNPLLESFQRASAAAASAAAGALRTTTNTSTSTSSGGNSRRRTSGSAAGAGAGRGAGRGPGKM